MPVVKDQRYIVQPEVLTRLYEAGYKFAELIPDQITTIPDLKQFVDDTFPRFDGELALITVARVFNRASTEVTDVTEVP